MQALNVIYVDAPVGTGFSYSNTSEGYYSGDVKSAVLTYEFLRKVHNFGFWENKDFLNELQSVQ